MARYENTLSTLQARTILDYIKSTAPAMASKEAVEDFALEMVEKLENDFSDFFPVNNNGPKRTIRTFPMRPLPFPLALVSPSKLVTCGFLITCQSLRKSKKAMKKISTI